MLKIEIFRNRFLKKHTDCKKKSRNRIAEASSVKHITTSHTGKSFLRYALLTTRTAICLGTKKKDVHDLME